jgi:osmotically-inducible protein OsmY
MICRSTVSPLTRIAAKAALAAVLLLIPVAASAVSEQPKTTDLTSVFREKGVTGIDDMLVVEVGGIVVIRGRVVAQAEAETASRVARELGYTRVANLVRVVEPIDDKRIERMAERELMIHRSLDGCTISVDSEGGVVRLVGSVRHELQKDVAISLIRNIDGVRAVRSELNRN